MKQFLLIGLLSGGLFLNACNSGTNTTSSDSTTSVTTENTANRTALKPHGAKPDWAPQMHDEMAVVIEKLASFNAKPIESLTAVEARQQATPTDAVMAVMKDNNIAMPEAKCDTIGRDIPGGNGVTIHTRIYTPKNAGNNNPVIVYYHGGGWVIASNDVYNASAQALCEQTGAVVVSVEYRKGPEAKFPAAHMDALAAYEWTLKNAATFKGDAGKVAVVGESAGGNLACNVSIMARDKGLLSPVYQVLIYPIAQNDMNTASYQKNAMAKPLNKPMMEWFAKQYLPGMEMSGDPRIALVKANLKGLPPTTIITAELDPLHDDGKMLADKLTAAGVTVNYKNYEGVTHEFFGMATVVPEAKDAQSVAAADLKMAFSKGSSRPITQVK
jgi:acetyl esterase